MITDESDASPEAGDASPKVKCKPGLSIPPTTRPICNDPEDHDRRQAEVRRQNVLDIKWLARETVLLRDQVLEVRKVDGRLHVARKERQPDEPDPPGRAEHPARRRRVTGASPMACKLGR